MFCRQKCRCNITRAFCWVTRPNTQQQEYPRNICIISVGYCVARWVVLKPFLLHSPRHAQKGNNRKISFCVRTPYSNYWQSGVFLRCAYYAPSRAVNTLSYRPIVMRGPDWVGDRLTFYLSPNGIRPPQMTTTAEEHESLVVGSNLTSTIQSLYEEKWVSS